MQVVPSNCAVLAVLVALLLLPGSLRGQQFSQRGDDFYATAIATDRSSDSSEADAPPLLDPNGFIPNWKTLLSIVGADDDADPRRRFFVGYEQMLFASSPTPANGVVYSRAAQASPHVVPSIHMPPAAGNESQSFAATVLENLGSGALGSLAPNLGTGNRLEFGRVEADGSGWSVSILDLNGAGQNAQSSGGDRPLRSR